MSKRHAAEYTRNYASESGKQTPRGPCPRFGLSRKARVSSKLFKSPLLSPAALISPQTTPEVKNTLLDKSPGKVSSRNKAKKNLQDDFNGDEVDNKKETEQIKKEKPCAENLDVPKDTLKPENITKAVNIDELLSNPVLTSSHSHNSDPLPAKPLRGRKKQLQQNVHNKESEEIGVAINAKVIITNELPKKLERKAQKTTTKDNEPKQVTEKKKIDENEAEFQAIKPKRTRYAKPLIRDYSEENMPIIKIPKKSGKIHDTALNLTTTQKESVIIIEEYMSPDYPPLGPQIELKASSRLKNKAVLKQKKFNQQVFDTTNDKSEAMPQLTEQLEIPEDKIKKSISAKITISETPMSFNSVNSDDSLPLAILCKKSTGVQEGGKDNECLSDRNENKVSFLKETIIDTTVKPSTSIKRNKTSTKLYTDKPIPSTLGKIITKADLSQIDILPLSNESKKTRKSFSLKRSSDDILITQTSDSDDEFGEFESSFHKKPKRILSSSSESNMCLVNDKLLKHASGLSEIENLALSGKLFRKDSLQGETLNNLNVELIRNEIASMQTTIKEKQSKLNAIKQATIYRNMHKVSEINQLTTVWEEGCKKALINLHQKMTEHEHQISMEVLIEKFNLPQDVFKFDSFNYCFV